MARKKDVKTDDLNFGQVSVIPAATKDIPAQFPKICDLLTALNDARDLREAIDIIVFKTPDGKAALNTYLRLANQGIKIEWFNKSTGKRTKRYDGESDVFCSKVGRNNTAGLDGVIDQFHYGTLVLGGMAAEVVVSRGVDDIDEVIIIDVSTIERFVWDERLKRYRIYQKRDGVGGEKIDLCEGNFFYIPNEPKPGRPDGTLQFESAVYAMAHRLKLTRDSGAVLERIGYPRYNTSIDDEKFYASLPGSIKADTKKLKEVKEEYFRKVEEQCRSAGYNSDFISWASVKREILGGNSSLGVDVRSFTEITDIEIPQAFAIPPIIMGRGQGKGSYALGTVEMQILVGKIDAMRRASKRMLENIMNLWARVKGYNISCKVTHNPIDWEKQLDKLEAQLKNIEVYRRMEEYGYIDTDEAARNVANVEKAEGTPNRGFAYITKGAKDSEGNQKPKEPEDDSEDE